jgi:hypothetical protein
MPMIARILIICAAGLLLTACQSGKMLTSIPSGEAKVFEAPPYAVRGVTKYDQGWIDSQVEGGVAAFGWPRPAARPAALDKHPAIRPAPAPAKKRGVVKRIKDRITGNNPAIAPVPYLPPAPVAQPVPATPPPPRDRVDELLRPTEPRVVYPK